MHAGQLIETLAELGIMPDTEYVICGDVAIGARYNDTVNKDLVTVDFFCVATEKFADVFKLAADLREF